MTLSLSSAQQRRFDRILNIQLSNEYAPLISFTQLEHMLETQFGAPSGKEFGLHDKITAARYKGQPLPDGLQKQMRKLVTIRNKLVHERDFNEIPERPEFVASYDQVCY